MPTAETDLALIVLRDSIAEFANARGWDPEDEAVAAAVGAAHELYRSGSTLAEACDAAQAQLRRHAERSPTP